MWWKTLCMQLELHFEFQISRKYASQGIQTMTCSGCHNNLLEMPVLQNMFFDDFSDNDPVASVYSVWNSTALPSQYWKYIYWVDKYYIYNLNQYIYKYLTIWQYYLCDTFGMPHKGHRNKNWKCKQEYNSASQTFWNLNFRRKVDGLVRPQDCLNFDKRKTSMDTDRKSAKFLLIISHQIFYSPGHLQCSEPEYDTCTPLEAVASQVSRV